MAGHAAIFNHHDPLGSAEVQLGEYVLLGRGIIPISAKEGARPPTPALPLLCW